MASTFMLKVRISLKSLKPVLHQGSFSTLNTSLCQSPQLPLSARFLCTRDTSPNSGGRNTLRRNSGQTDRQWGVKNSTVRQREEEWWDVSAEGRRKSSPLWQRPSPPKSVFDAGTAKRHAEMMKRKAALVSHDEEQHEEGTEGKMTRGSIKIQPPDRPLTVSEWRELKESLGNSERFNLRMMCSLVNANAELDIAKSLLTFVAMETGTLTYELLLRYLTLCVGGNHDEEVFDVYGIMKESFPHIDTGASTLFIKSFSRTERWREAISILQELKKVFTPSTSNYTDIITAAMLNGDAATAWAVYDELIEKGLNPQQRTFDSLFKGAGRTSEPGSMSESEHQERLLQILLHMRNNQIYPQQDLASSIKAWFESLPGQKWTGSWTKPTPKGVCRCCGSELESIQLTAEEYQQLKDRVMADVIQGKDIFNKTTPEELQRFRAFVKRKPAFDVVVDGLNVANYNKDKSKQSDTLLAVVSELESQGLVVLVLGRKHMLRPSRAWDRHNMKAIQQKAFCFFTDNISEDDPFLLYAALNSGNHCRFVSRDLMRDHKACLSDKASRRLFFKWQRGHQLVLDGYVMAGRKVRFQSIHSYDTIVQNTTDTWHVPYDDTEDRSTYEIPKQWLCLTTKH